MSAGGDMIRNDSMERLKTIGTSVISGFGAGDTCSFTIPKVHALACMLCDRSAKSLRNFFGGSDLL